MAYGHPLNTLWPESVCMYQIYFPSVFLSKEPFENLRVREKKCHILKDDVWGLSYFCGLYQNLHVQFAKTLWIEKIRPEL